MTLLLLLPVIPVKGPDFKILRQSDHTSHFLHINGYSYHFSSDRNKLNEFNYGFGFSYYLGHLQSSSPIVNDLQVFAEVDLYSDSFSETGYLFGASFQKPLLKKLDFGLHFGLIHENNLQDKSGLFLHPYLFPYLQTNYDAPINARILFIPPIHNKGIIAAQAMIRF